MGRPDDELPPQYADGDEDDQLIAPPPYTAPDGQIVIPAVTKFPVALNAYFQRKLSRTIYLGPSRSERLFAVETHSGGFTGKKPTIILRDGPGDTDPILATAGFENKRQTKYYITLPGRPGPDGASDTTIIMNSATLTSSKHGLSIPVGEKGQVEQFEWRSSHGDEIKTLAGSSWGYKLARLEGPNTKASGSSSSSSSAAAREVGFTSDGHEVVAVFAPNGSASLTKAVRFCFMGSGMTGTMGEAWEIVALTSALKLFEVYYVAITS